VTTAAQHAELATDEARNCRECDASSLYARSLYAITDRRTGAILVRPGGQFGGVGPEVLIRLATRAEAEEHWQNPLSPGWRVAS
jgi:hypothetical protein